MDHQDSFIEEDAEEINDEEMLIEEASDVEETVEEADENNDEEGLLYVGKSFPSFHAFNSCLVKYEAKNYCKFSVLRSDKASEKFSKLYYKSAKFACKQFGEKRDNPSVTCERPRQKTYKTGCSAFFHLTLDKKNELLIIDEFHGIHNHDCNRVTFAGYPESRRLSSESIAKTVELRGLNVKPTRIRPHLRDTEQEKIILARDISNVWTKSKAADRNGRSDEEMLRDRLQKIKDKDPGACVHLPYDGNTGEVEYLLIQTSEMRKDFQKFPEVLIMDVTYKINKNQMPVSVIETMDGDGFGQVVAYAFLSNEQKPTLTNMLMKFVESSGEEFFKDTHCVIVDKDFAEIGAIRTVMPSAAVHICSVHTERNFKKLVKGLPGKKEMMESLVGMIHSETEEEFKVHLKAFREKAPSSVVDTFEKNWMHMKEAWSLKDRALVKTLRNHTTNRVESHNQKLKMVFDVDTPLYVAVDGLVGIILANKRDDVLYRDHEALTKKVYINKCSEPLVMAICNDLTGFAAKLLCEQWQLSKKFANVHGRYETSVRSCNCTFFKTMGITCRHMMRSRRDAGIAVYEKESESRRWWKEYNIRSNFVQGEIQDIAQPATSSEITVQPRMPAGPISRTMKPSEMFNKVSSWTDKLNKLSSNSGTRIFHQRLQVLIDLVNAWSEGSTVAIVTLNAHQLRDFPAEASDVKPLPILGNNDPVVITLTDLSDTENDVEEAVGSSHPRDQFKLCTMKTFGKPYGRCETVHDGSKKIVKSRYIPSVQAEVNKCCVCLLEAGDHCCIHCKKKVHAIAPCSTAAPNSVEGYGQTRVCTTCKGKEAPKLDTGLGCDSSVLDASLQASNSDIPQKKVEFKLDIVRTKGRNKDGQKKSGKYKWNYSCLADEEAKCFICELACGSDSCQICKNPVHSKPACSVLDDVKGRICQICKDITQSNVASQIKDPGVSAKKANNDSTMCYGCKQQYVRRIAKTAKNLGRPYLGCPVIDATAVCKRFRIWEPTSMGNSLGNSSTQYKAQEIPKDQNSGDCSEAIDFRAMLNRDKEAIECESTLRSISDLEKDIMCDSGRNRPSENRSPEAVRAERFCLSVNLMECRQKNPKDCYLKALFTLQVLFQLLMSSNIEKRKDIKILFDAGSHQNEFLEVNYCQELLHYQFLDIQGLKPCIAQLDLLKNANYFATIDQRKDYIQILYDGSKYYFIFLLPQGKRIPLVLDFHRKEHRKLPSFVESQIALIMKEQLDEIKYLRPACQQLTNCSQSNFLAAAYATQFAFNRTVQYVEYDLENLKQHAIKCYRSKRMLLFPDSGRLVKRTRFAPDEESFKIVCKCRLPEHFGNLICCDECHKWFHICCVNAPVHCEEDQMWMCPTCSWDL